MDWRPRVEYLPAAEHVRVVSLGMNITFTKSFWEMDFTGLEDPMGDFISRVAAAGFDGTELFLPLIPETPDRVLELHQQAGLRPPIIDIVTDGETPADHAASFDRSLARALEFDPPLINSHTGRDIFAFEDNVALFAHAIARSREVGVPVVHETHRYRPTYSAIETRRYLEELPDLLLNADFSHWMVVHESDLSDQEHNLESAIARSRHIHARVGFEEGPQVNDPRSPEWSDHVARHIELWRRIVASCLAAGVATLAITPEFGPPPYAPTLPGTAEPVADVWDINVYMKDLLRRELGSVG